jgi:hypothetical protein
MRATEPLDCAAGGPGEEYLDNRRRTSLAFGMRLAIRPLTPALWPALEDLFKYEPTRAGKKIFKKSLAEVEFRGCQTTKGVGQIKPKEKYHAIHDADDPRRLSRR